MATQDGLKGSEGRKEQAEYDALSHEVAQHRLAFVVQEGGSRAARSAGSAFVSGGNSSCACAIFTRDGQQVTQTPGGMHTAALREMMPFLLQSYPREEMREGDVFLCNDPFAGGIHPTDLAALRPIFWDGEVAFFTALMMIVGDMGGMSSGGLPATATEVFHEGLVVPPTRIVDAGVENEGALRIVMANSRIPAKLRTDIDALVGASAIVSERLREMIGRYGLVQLEEIIGRLFDHAEALVRNSIAAIPDGEYFGSYKAEDDGVGPAPFYEVKVRIKVEGSEILFDFTGTSNQATGAINSSLSQSQSFTHTAFQHYITPTIDMNEGFYRPMKMVFPEGSVLNPLFPGACNMRYSVGQALTDAVHEALRPLFPERSVAPSSSITTANANCATPGAPQWAMLDVTLGAGGGRPGFDANDGLSAQMQGTAGYMINVEAYEKAYPVLYEQYRLVPDSAGPGQWRGAAGMSKTMRFLEDATVTFRTVDRTKRPPLGAEGGEPGRGGGWIVNPGQPNEKRLPPKVTNYPIKANDLVTGSVAGGGGYGPPLKRDPEMVLADVRKGFVTPEGAEHDYGVILTQSGELDPAATRDLRAKRQEA